jgi:hypothetical protein
MYKSLPTTVANIGYMTRVGVKTPLQLLMHGSDNAILVVSHHLVPTFQRLV